VDNSNLEAGVSLLEAVLDVVKCRLLTTIDDTVINSASNGTVIPLLEQLSAALHKQILHFLRKGGVVQSMNHTSRLATLLTRISEVEQYKVALTELKKKTEQDCTLRRSENPHTVNAWDGWRDNSTVGWLMSGDWHDIGAGLKSVYESPGEYAETLLRIWTLLTFYWGAGAVTPKCRHQQQQSKSGSGENVICGIPLLALTDKGTCTRCGKKASWKCSRNGHELICYGCMVSQQGELTGPPGPRASTDIYDGKVIRESNRNGCSIYFISSLQSRRPPAIAPNWKTTYRLPIAGLVGIVRLSVSKEAILRQHTIEWAEIVAWDAHHGGADKDWDQRAKGNIALRLLNAGDCPGMPGEADSQIEPGTQVAVIDLRVFVPEVVSVLATFAASSFPSTLHQIPFIDRLIGRENSPSRFVFNEIAQPEVIIEAALMESEIEFIRRLSPSARLELVAKICAIPAVKSLYGTQLEAFTSALFSAIHCTQGPPGTGKSYIGVCLVLALDVIRKKAEQMGISVGPILVLSYKNHALDEFLMDVIKSDPMIRPGMLIRSGNPEVDELRPFKERFSPFETDAQKELGRRIAVQRRSKLVSKDWVSCYHFLSSAAHSLEEGANFVSIEWTPFHCPPKIAQVDINTATTFCYAIAVFDKVKSEMMLYDVSASDAKNDFQSIPPESAFNIIEVSNTADFFIDNVVKLQERVSSALSLLVAELDHWKCPYQRQDLRTLFLVDQWLKGKSPPPRCLEMVGDKRCRQAASECSSFCDLLHRCKLVSCVQRRGKCVIYCAEHSCSFVNQTNGEERNQLCGRLRATWGGAFCESHACMNCVQACSPNIQAAVPLACPAHQCIWDKGCKQPQIFPFLFCEQHLCEECSRTGAHPYFPCINEQSTLCVSHKCLIPDCEKVQIGQSGYCSFHVCCVCFAVEGRFQSVDLTAPQSQLCAEHRCSHQEFCEKRRHEFSKFCVQHSCKVCMNNANSMTPITNPVLDEEPRNSCSEHPLCNKIFKNGRLCNQVSVPPGIFCAVHSEGAGKPNKVKKKQNKVEEQGFDSRQCWGVAKKTKRRCKAKSSNEVKGKWYCGAHLDQKAESESDSPSSDEEEDEYDETGPSKLQEENFLHLKGKVRSFIPAPSKSSYVLVSCQGVSLKIPCQMKSFCVVGQTWNCLAHSKVPLAPVVTTQDDKPHSNNVQKFNQTQEEVPDTTLGKMGQPEAKTGEQPKPGFDKNNIDAAVQIPIHNNQPGLASSEPQFSSEDFLSLELEAPAGNIHPDELDFEEDILMEEEENDDIQRIKQMTDLESDSDSDEESVAGEKVELDLETDSFQSLEDEVEFAGFVHQLTWGMVPSERLRAASRFFHVASLILTRLRKLANTHVAAARRDRAEAGAHAYRSTRIIGATVVGAARRLEAIRAAQPFAAVVEEACEVMEPTLMSVLAVQSLRKLEMIGDHRQLPAFVQQCWFNLEGVHPSIKTSLFERLINGGVHEKKSWKKTGWREPGNNPLPFSILDEQRRMRVEIANITRPDYEDLVEIKDHPHTSKQLIGDVFLRLPTNKFGSQVRYQQQILRAHRELWAGKGRTVPGIASCVFFWDISNNSESKAISGLSACNQKEAEAAANLTKYLLLCGVPPGAISIITPYKGQKRVITLELQKLHCLGRYNRDNPPLPGTTVSVSTVDRYQGDENDIIILSLVRVRPGNMFVALQNRFVVAMSRARLGFFIVGSKEAVTKSRDGSAGPAHWNRFLSTLISPVDEVPMLDSSDCPQASRVGCSLPICCPQHYSLSNVNSQVKQSLQFPDPQNWCSFCSLPCQFRLECGHVCSLPCHVPKVTNHEQKCAVHLDRPCKRHLNIPLRCHDIEKQATHTAEQALAYFKCKIQEPYLRKECGHEVLVDCFMMDAYINGDAFLPKCEVTVEDFYHPRCNHVFESPKCYQRLAYEKNPPKCMVKVQFKKPCGCTDNLSCDETIQESVLPSKCNKAVQFDRPRCGHKLSLRCFERSELKRCWEGQDGISLDKTAAMAIVRHVHLPLFYGPPESTWNSKVPRCSVPVTYQGPCGHYFDGIACTDAFDFVFGTKSPLKCTQAVQFTCACCQHLTTVPCWAVPSLKEWRPWNIDACFTTHPNDAGEVMLKESIILQSTAPILPKELQRILLDLCKRDIKVLLACGHSITVVCNTLPPVIWKKSHLPNCCTEVRRQLDCGHFSPVKCHELLKNPPPNCNVPIEISFAYPCGLHTITVRNCQRLLQLQKDETLVCPEPVQAFRYRCGHALTVPCYQKKAVEKPLPGVHFCVSSEVVVNMGEDYCESELGFGDCEKHVDVVFVCGHRKSGVQCSLAFKMSEDPDLAVCTELVPFLSPVCNHCLSVPCNLKEELELSTRDAWNGFPPDFEDVTERVDENCDPVTCRVVEESAITNNKISIAAKHSAFMKCNEPAILIRECGHGFKTKCSQAYNRNVGLCRELVMWECPVNECKHTEKISCHEYEKGLRTGIVCRNLVRKLCTHCMLNVVEVECYKVDVECKMEASVVLDCGHELQWMCGSHEDPRKTLLVQCHDCLKDRWRSALKNEPTHQEFELCFQQQRERIRNALNEVGKVISVEEKKMTKKELERFSLARNNIVASNHDRVIHSSGKCLEPPPSRIGTEADKNNFDLVYCLGSQKNSFFNPVSTEYGQGYDLLRFSGQSFASFEPSADGSIEICVGIAYRFNLLEDAPPFSAKTGKKNEWSKRANQKMQKIRNKGFDCVKADFGEKEQKNVKNKQRVIYWFPGSVLLLGTAKVRLHDPCCICCDLFTADKGFYCDKKHLICWGCLADYAQSESSAGAVGTQNVDNKGQLTCPECRAPYLLNKLAGESTPQHVFDRLENLKIERVAQAALTKELAEQEKRLKEEFEKILKIQNLDERKAHELAFRIEHVVLNLCCPRCKQVFIDFQGCFALSCPRATCRAAFCAWCLKDCGQDAHPHVAVCPENQNRGDYFGTDAQFKEHHREKREREIQRIVQQETKEVQRILQRLLDKSLQELGINIAPPNEGRPPDQPGIGPGGFFGNFFRF